MTDLYERALVDHAKRPRHFGALEGATHTAEGVNPLCGDELTVRLRVEGGRILDIAFQGAGCAVCIGSASLMTVAARGLALRDVDVLLRRVRALLGGQQQAQDLGELAALSGVARFAARVKCAALAWSALETALAGGRAPVSTES